MMLITASEFMFIYALFVNPLYAILNLINAYAGLLPMKLIEWMMKRWVRQEIKRLNKEHYERDLAEGRIHTYTCDIDPADVETAIPEDIRKSVMGVR